MLHKATPETISNSLKQRRHVTTKILVSNLDSTYIENKSNMSWETFKGNVT
jgi:hypothetical protein